MYSGRPPFSELREDCGVVFRVPYGIRPSRPIGSPGRALPSWLWAIVEASWHQDPSQRPNIDTILRSFHLGDTVMTPENTLLSTNFSETDALTPLSIVRRRDTGDSSYECTGGTNNGALEQAPRPAAAAPSTFPVPHGVRLQIMPPGGHDTIHTRAIPLWKTQPTTALPTHESRLLQIRTPLQLPCTASFSLARAQSLADQVGASTKAKVFECPLFSCGQVFEQLEIQKRHILDHATGRIYDGNQWKYSEWSETWSQPVQDYENSWCGGSEDGATTVEDEFDAFEGMSDVAGAVRDDDILKGKVGSPGSLRGLTIIPL